MTNPQFIEEQPLSLVDVKQVLAKVEKRDKELNHLSNKTKEFLDSFTLLSPEKKGQLHKQLLDLNLTRIKEEHINKIIDFLPVTANDLKVVFMGYHMSLPKKDMDSIVEAVKEFVK